MQLLIHYFFPVFYLFIRIIQVAPLICTLFCFFSCYHVAVPNPAGAGIDECLSKNRMKSIFFVTNLVFGGTQVASLDIVYYVFPVLDRMASDFLIGFEWKSHKTDYQGEYLSDVKKNVFIEQK